jgi:hypothetical protein
VALVLICGGTELFSETTVVHCSDTEFHIRSTPYLDDPVKARKLAEGIDEEMGKVARVRDSYQTHPWDLEYTPCKCVQGQPDRRASTSS